MSDYLDPENEELLKDFFLEAETQVETIERTILALEQWPGDGDSLDELFRAAHTLKGGAYTVQMNELAVFTHKVEDLLDEAREGKVVITPDLVDLLLNSIDVIKVMFEERMAGRVYGEDTSELEARLLARTCGGGAPAASPGEEVAGAEESDKFPMPLSTAEWNDLNVQAENTVFRVRVHFDESNPMNTIGAVQEFARLKELGTLWITHPDLEELYEDNFFEYVDFYLETEAGPEDILKHAYLDDVTLDIEVNELSETFAGGGEEEGEVSGSPASEKTQEQEDVAAADSAGMEGLSSSDAERKEQEGKEEKQQKKKDNAANAVLRVESRRIDEILNLVSEAVINKATFNQVKIQLLELVGEVRLAHTVARDRLGVLVSNFFDHEKQIQLQKSHSTLRKELQSKAAEIYGGFGPLEKLLKEIITQFNHSSANLARNTNDLHEAILSMRMVPISQVFSRFPRLVRDLSRSLDKKVNLVLKGEETEIDKSVAEELVDPLMHCVRNSMDHGIEAKEERRKTQKPESGTVILSAANEGNNVVIEISDDGAGIGIDRVRKKAIDNGVIPPNKILSDQEAFNLIFDPGFSTAQAVTNLSGRGVGLDVVRKQIEKLNGAVDVWSVPGQGTRFTIKLPLTLAIIQGLLVRVCTEVYAIPITAVAESIRIKPGDIRMIDGCEVINVREDVISLLRLNRIFQLDEKEYEDDFMFVVIVGTAERRVGLMVDMLIGEEDVVIKPLIDRYTYSLGVAGATILGDGIVSLILDVNQLLDLGIQYERFMRNQVAS